MKRRYYVIFEGRVQNVGFRWTVQQIAQSLGCTGWIRNLDNGNVDMQIQGVSTLNVCQSEKEVVKSIITLQRQGHPASSHRMSADSGTVQLSPRELEVTILLTKGLINKEIADRMNISITTVITHRKNIMEKLKARSLADIIIYAVMNGYVNLGEL